MVCAFKKTEKGYTIYHKNKNDNSDNTAGVEKVRELEDLIENLIPARSPFSDLVQVSSLSSFKSNTKRLIGRSKCILLSQPVLGPQL